MADEANDKPAKNSKTLILVGGAVVLAAAFGGAVYWHHSGDAPHAHGDDAAAAHADHANHAPAQATGDAHAGHDHGPAAGAAPDAAAHDHDHGDHALAGGLGALTLNDGKKWETDEPLRAGITRMHDATLVALGPYKAGTLTAEQGAALSASITKEINFLIANCKLDPKADAQLHMIIGELAAGGSAVKADPQSKDGVMRIAKALHAYLEYFNHPGGFGG